MAALLWSAALSLSCVALAAEAAAKANCSSFALHCPQHQKLRADAAVIPCGGVECGLGDAQTCCRTFLDLSPEHAKKDDAVTAEGPAHGNAAATTTLTTATRTTATVITDTLMSNTVTATTTAVTLPRSTTATVVETESQTRTVATTTLTSATRTSATVITDTLITDSVTTTASRTTATTTAITGTSSATSWTQTVLQVAALGMAVKDPSQQGKHSPSNFSKIVVADNSTAGNGSQNESSAKNTKFVVVGSNQSTIHHGNGTSDENSTQNESNESAVVLFPNATQAVCGGVPCEAWKANASSNLSENDSLKAGLTGTASLEKLNASSNNSDVHSAATKTLNASGNHSESHTAAKKTPNASDNHSENHSSTEGSGAIGGGANVSKDRELERELEVPAPTQENISDDLSCLLWHGEDQGCGAIRDKDLCLRSMDGRPWQQWKGRLIHGQPCAWCNGENCTINDDKVCMPADWVKGRANLTVANCSAHSNVKDFREKVAHPTAQVQVEFEDAGHTGYACGAPHQSASAKFNLFYYTHSAGSLEQCKRMCSVRKYCKGVEYQEHGRRCLLWWQTIQSMERKHGHSCARASGSNGSGFVLAVNASAEAAGTTTTVTKSTRTTTTATTRATATATTTSSTRTITRTTSSSSAEPVAFENASEAEMAAAEEEVAAAVEALHMDEPHGAVSVQNAPEQSDTTYNSTTTTNGGLSQQDKAIIGGVVGGVGGAAALAGILGGVLGTTSTTTMTTMVINVSSLRGLLGAKPSSNLSNTTLNATGSENASNASGVAASFFHAETGLGTYLEEYWWAALCVLICAAICCALLAATGSRGRNRSRATDLEEGFDDVQPWSQAQTPLAIPVPVERIEPSQAPTRSLLAPPLLIQRFQPPVLFKRAPLAAPAYNLLPATEAFQEPAAASAVQSWRSMPTQPVPASPPFAALPTQQVSLVPTLPASPARSWAPETRVATPAAVLSEPATTPRTPPPRPVLSEPVARSTPNVHRH